MRIKVSNPRPLLSVLREILPSASNRTLRQMLREGRVRVNGEVCRRGSDRLKTGDLVEVGPRSVSARETRGIRILYEDRDLLVVEKPAGLLTVATDHEQRRTAYAYLRTYLKDNDARSRLFIVHRLDKLASGLLVFAKSPRVKEALQQLFREHRIERKYWAIVEGRVSEDSGTIRSYLEEDSRRRMASTRVPGRGKQAVTHFRVLKRGRAATALEVTLETGRKNQIRVHLSEMRHPILGDRSYGSTLDPLGRLGLHAFWLGFEHPSRAVKLVHRSNPPAQFRAYLPKTLFSRKTAPGSE